MDSRSGNANNHRLGGLDALRVAAALAVVVLHASVPYLRVPMPGLPWPVTDHADGFTHWFGWTIELVVMPLFLLLSGYLAWPQLQRHGAGEFLKNRFFRLIVPVLVLGPILLTADLYIWLAGWLIEGKITARKIQSLAFDHGEDRDLWGTSHLWYLQYLFIYSFLLTTGYRWYTKQSRQFTPNQWHGVILALLSVATLILWPEVVFGFQHSMLPVASKWIYSGLFFVGGVLLANSPQFEQWLQQRIGWLLSTGMIASSIAIGIGCWSIEASDGWTLPRRNLTQALESALLAITTAGSAWTLALAFLVMATRATLKSSPRLRYWAGATFWIYLVHHPIVGLTHIVLKAYGPTISPTLKLIIATLTAIIVAMMSFDVVARRRPLAKLLGLSPELTKGRLSTSIAAGTDQCLHASRSTVLPSETDATTKAA